MSVDKFVEDNKGEIKSFFKTLGWYFGSKETPTGFYSTIGRIDEKLGRLIETLHQADESSTKLTKALNTLTFAGVVIAGFGLLVAIGNLVLDYLKFTRGV